MAERSSKQSARVIIALVCAIIVAIVTLCAILYLRKPAEEMPAEPVETIPEEFVEPTYNAPDDAEEITLGAKKTEITKAGKYILAGTTNKAIEVKADGEVTLYLNKVSVNAVGSSAIINNTDEALNIVILTGTENSIIASGAGENGVIYSKADVGFSGNGGLKIINEDEGGVCVKTEGNYISHQFNGVACTGEIISKEYVKDEN